MGMVPRGRNNRARATDEADMIGIFITDNAFEIFYKDDE